MRASSGAKARTEKQAEYLSDEKRCATQNSALHHQKRRCTTLLFIDFSVFHHEADFFQHADILQGITRNGDYVG
jgi:hypothetical protein